MTEFELIRLIASGTALPDGITGIGDDCAIIPSVMPDASPAGTAIPGQAGHTKDVLVTTDLLAEGIHFLPDLMTPEDIGFKSAAVNISDIAAMGGTPEFAFLSLALPASSIQSLPAGEHRNGELPRTWIERFMSGFKECLDRFGVSLLGGDTSASKGGIFINVTLMGSCHHGTAVKRSGALPGDLICVTGTLGDSAAGLKLMMEEASSGSDGRIISRLCHLIRRHCRPEPRVAEGQALRECPGVHAMMDISDGVASDLPHILESSSIGAGDGSKVPIINDNAASFGATIDVRSLPLSPELRSICDSRGWDPVDLALCGGEDYELLFTMAPGTDPGIPFTVIGTIDPSPGLRWLGGLATYDGFRHF